MTKKLDELLATLKAAQTAYSNELDAVSESRSPFPIGSIVENVKGEKFTVDSFICLSKGNHQIQPWSVNGRKLKKDGKPSARIQFAGMVKELKIVEEL